MKRIKILSTALVLCMLATIFFGCAKQTESTADSPKPADSTKTVAGKVPTIRYISWTTPSSPNTKPAYDAISAFAAEHENEFKLEHENVLGDELKAKIKVDIASKTVPDIFLYWGSTGNSIVLLESDVIIPFDEYLDASENISRNLFPESSFSRTSANGVLTTVTDALQLGYWFCNQELFDKFGLPLPKTLDDMLAVGKVFSENGVTPFAMGSKGGNPSHEFVAEILGQMPGSEKDFANLTTNYTVDTPNIKNTFNIIETMRSNKLFPSDTIALGDWGQQFAYYNEGKAAMIYGWTWQLPNMSLEMAKKTTIIDAPAMPGGTIDTSTYTRAGGDMGPMISKASWNDTNKKAAIISIVDFLYSKDMQLISLYNNGSIPSRVDIDFEKDKIAIPMLGDVIEYTKGRNSVPNFPQTCPETKVWTDFADAFDELFAGLITPDEAIKNIEDSLKAAKAESKKG